MGDNAGFLLGRQLGREVLAHRFSLLLTPKRIAGSTGCSPAGCRSHLRRAFRARCLHRIRRARWLLGPAMGHVPAGQLLRRAGLVAWICTLGYYGGEWGERLKPIWSGCTVPPGTLAVLICSRWPERSSSSAGPQQPAGSERRATIFSASMTSRNQARFSSCSRRCCFPPAARRSKASTLTGWQVASFRSGIAAVTLLLLVPATRRGWGWRPALVGVA